MCEICYRCMQQSFFLSFCHSSIHKNGLRKVRVTNKYRHLRFLDYTVHMLGVLLILPDTFSFKMSLFGFLNDFLQKGFLRTRCKCNSKCPNSVEASVTSCWFNDCKTQTVMIQTETTACEPAKQTWLATISANHKWQITTSDRMVWPNQ